MEIISCPPRDEKGAGSEPSVDFAEEVWHALDENSDIKVRIVKSRHQQHKASNEEVYDDISHDRYFIAMPQDFAVNVTRGFDFMTAGEDKYVNKAASVLLLPSQPPDVKAMLNLRGTGCVYPMPMQS